MRGRHRIVSESSRRGKRSKDHAGSQTLFVFDQRVPVAVLVRHVGLEGINGVGCVKHELHRRFSASLLRGLHSVRQERGGAETLRGEEQPADWTWRPFHVPFASQRKHRWLCAVLKYALKPFIIHTFYPVFIYHEYIVDLCS